LPLRSAADAIVLVTLMHIVETEKFVRAWRDLETLAGRCEPGNIERYGSAVAIS
jgi:hypothetical protein